MGEIDGRIALITGGAKGIGLAIAVALAEAGARVAICGRDQAALDAARATIGQGTLALRCDVADSKQIHEMITQVEAQLGAIDILINNAGITASMKTVEMPEATWEHIMRVNLTSAFLCCQEVLPGMITARWGRIVNIASIAARIGLRYSAAYAASKHGLLGFTRSLALETARQGITVNAVCPGWTTSDMLNNAVANISATTGRSAEDATAVLAAMSPQARIIEPEEVARAVMFLVSPAANGITGQAINIDGGSVMS